MYNFFLNLKKSSLITYTPTPPSMHNILKGNSQSEEKDYLAFKSPQPGYPLLFPNLSDGSHVLIYLFLSISSFILFFIKCLFIFYYGLTFKLNISDVERRI